ncbi:hypothetical protein FQ087_02950 [Sporosarcina sp. ANT_H38]|uniref:hypothetical protein n=1 Tax=Sporosarcina sp. ANT_H38 TaxID=2597358 RepID=UPI0011F28A3D|nr:hypothetical protein [Sporosarcina sp. ANT_H38]KAA0965282.1 hypothetical protein FQ087_02950 [Sporosarcina sp. ANT_H38]
MTKKTGLFDVDFTLTTKALTTPIKGEKATTALYKLFSKYCDPNAGERLSPSYYEGLRYIP